MANKIENDWRESLKTANLRLKKKNMEIVVTEADEGYFNIDIYSLKEHRSLNDFVSNDFEEELEADIREAYLEALKMAENGSNKLYIVTYVGLSDNDDEANGYSEVKAYNSLDKAKAKLKRYKNCEINDIKDRGDEYEILTDTDMECRISWGGGSEQVRILIHEVALNEKN